ncbi:hypothetical protein CLV56_2245 [Mumia flava]|uniref:MmpS family membrane protein n=1 Tax=Mumia flava TaxID=1348852 RepID=A0A0B2BUA0_9ACTN|nr:hypothetical protein [Mumia flava]PJJ58002.1 hypothetical protein CLV56_2245 [Mumia flava]
MRARRSGFGVLVGAGVLLLAGCAGDGAASADPSADPSDAPTSQPADSEPRRHVDAAADLESFDCVPVGDGTRWRAAGVLVNSADKADFRVTVLVAPPGATGVKARRVVIPKVATGVETPFEIAAIPVNGSDALTCRVQVTRLR